MFAPSAFTPTLSRREREQEATLSAPVAAQDAVGRWGRGDGAAVDAAGGRAGGGVAGGGAGAVGARSGFAGGVELLEQVLVLRVVLVRGEGGAAQLAGLVGGDDADVA